MPDGVASEVEMSGPPDRGRVRSFFDKFRRKPVSPPPPANPPQDRYSPEVGPRKTQILMDRLRSDESKLFEEPGGEAPYGMFEGRRIIGRDTPINGGVYLGSGAREAIVVDDKDSKLLNDAYRQVLVALQPAIANNTYKNIVLDTVFNKARELLPYNEYEAERLAADHHGDRKIHIEMFLNIKAGVCRHQALLAGYFLERLVKEDYIGGKVSVDRNFLPGRGGHAWVRYTNSLGEIYVIDPAQNYIGPLKNMGDDRISWFYERREDKNIK